MVDSTGALALKEVPKHMLILGGGMAAEIAHGSCTDVPLAKK